MRTQRRKGTVDRGERKKFFVEGRQVDFWEDPNIPFAWNRDDLEEYAMREEWVKLFNAIMLASQPQHSEAPLVYS